jgi:SAM-dependent methyltransferase
MTALSTRPSAFEAGTGAPVKLVERDPRSAYWERLREPAALVARDLAVIRQLAPTTPVLDVGCGNGGFVRACIDDGVDAIGIEAFGESVAIARAAATPVVKGVGERLPLATGAFDVVRLKEVLEHVQAPLPMTAEMRRALRPGGTFLCYVPTQWSQLYPFPANFYDDYTHVRAFSRVGLGRLLEDAGFTAIKIDGYTPPLRNWQRPIGAFASRVFPFLWRATARNGSGGPRA